MSYFVSSSRQKYSSCLPVYSRPMVDSYSHQYNRIIEHSTMEIHTTCGTRTQKQIVDCPSKTQLENTFYKRLEYIIYCGKFSLSRPLFQILYFDIQVIFIDFCSLVYSHWEFEIREAALVYRNINFS